MVGLLSLFVKGANGSFSNGRGTRGPAVLKMPVSARAQGMGGSYVAVVDDVAAVHWNPAGMQKVPQKSVQLMSSRLFAGQSQSFLGYVHPAWRNRSRETWGLSATLLDVDSFDVSEEGQPLGSSRPQEWVAGLSHARSLGRMSWGLTGKWVKEKIFEQEGQAFGLDLGLMGSNVTGRWGWGLTLTNLGTPLTLGSQEIVPPTTARAGGAYTKRMGEGRELLITGQVDLPVDDTVGERAGVEYGFAFHGDWHGAVRGGFQTAGPGNLSMGLGLSHGALSVNYAFLPNGDSGNAGFMDVTFRFGSALTEEVGLKKLSAQIQGFAAEGKLTQARETWNQMNEISPSYPAVRQWGRILRKEWETSLDPTAIMAQGEEAFQKGDYSKAADQFRKLLLLAPEHVEARERLEETERRVEADRLARLQAELAAAREKERRQWIQQAETLEAHGQWQTAMGLWAKLATGSEPNPRARDRLTACQARVHEKAEDAVRLNDTERAIDLFRALETTGYRDAGRRADALEEERARSRTATGLKKYREGRDAYTKGDLDAAQRLFEEAALLDPQRKEIRQALDQVRQELKLTHDAPSR